MSLDSYTLATSILQQLEPEGPEPELRWLRHSRAWAEAQLTGILAERRRGDKAELEMARRWVPSNFVHETLDMVNTLSRQALRNSKTAQEAELADLQHVDLGNTQYPTVDPKCTVS